VVTRGVGSRHTQVFGEYQWCMRTDAMPGTSTIVLLWPKDDRWPPEIDFFESRGNTKWYTMTLHYESSHRHLEVHKNVVTEDAARWNVYTAVWRPREIQIREDGVIVSTIVSSHVPVIPMRLDFQTQAVKANARAGASDIGWVVEYARAG
jgi:hypothetical protein